MRLSIVIPAFNEELYLGDCLAAVQAELGRSSLGESVEVIVIDNASTDRTAAVAQQFPNVRVVFEPVKGLTHARQRGLKEANGDVLAFVDADTMMPAGWIDRVLEAFDSKKEIVCVSGPYIYYDGPPIWSFLIRIYWVFLATPAYWVTGFMVVGGNFAVRKESLVQIGGFDTCIEFYGEDTNIARRLADVGKVKFLLRLAMFTSARRLHNEGLCKMAVKYCSSFLSEVIFKRSPSRSYFDIR